MGGSGGAPPEEQQRQEAEQQRGGAGGAPAAAVAPETAATAPKAKDGDEKALRHLDPSAAAAAPTRTEEAPFQDRADRRGGGDERRPRL